MKKTVIAAVVVLAAAVQAGTLYQGLSAPGRIRLTKGPASALSPCEIGIAGEIAASQARARAWEKYQKEEPARQKARQAEYRRKEREKMKAYFAKLDRLLAEKAENREQLEKLRLRIYTAWNEVILKQPHRRAYKTADKPGRTDRLLNDYRKRLETRLEELYQESAAGIEPGLKKIPVY